MICIFGSSGQLASSFRKILSNRADVRFFSSAEVPFQNTNSILNVLKQYQPSLIINCSAYTKVDLAETEKDLAFAINGTALKIIGEWAFANNSCVIHFSTDYVFSGDGTRSWKPSDQTSPSNCYGETKLAGEKFLNETKAKHFIFRTSWVYSEFGHNFVKSMLKLGQEREELSIVADQIGHPTYSGDLAKQITKLIDSNLLQNSFGIYHLAGSGTASWHDFALEIFSQAKKMGWVLKVSKINAISSSQFPTPAKRPLNSRFDMDSTKQKLGLELPLWQESLHTCLLELKTELTIRKL